MSHLTGADVRNCIKVGTLSEHGLDTVGYLVDCSGECTDGDIIQAVCEICRLWKSERIRSLALTEHSRQSRSVSAYVRSPLAALCLACQSWSM